MIGLLRRLFGRKSAADDTRDGAGGPVDKDADEDDGDEDDEDAAFDPDAVAPLTDELDLHTFQPRECADLVDEYIRAAREAKFSSVRVIHGKGKGVLRRIVHGVLEKHPDVESFQLADQRSGSWGATLVRLKP